MRLHMTAAVACSCIHTRKTMCKCWAYLELLPQALRVGLSCKGLLLAELNSVITLLDLGLMCVL